MFAAVVKTTDVKIDATAVAQLMGPGMKIYYLLPPTLS